MLSPTILLKRYLIFVHRWLGVALSILFTLWFVSGIVMMYWGFPGITRTDRLSRVPLLDPAQIQLSPEEAYARLKRDDSPGRALLTSFDGRPVYQFGAGGGGGRGRRGGRGGRGGGDAMVYADDGSLQQQVDPEMIDRAATQWASQTLSSAKKESVVAVDQWTVGSQLRTLRPLYKFSFADGQQVYVSCKDAQVVQYTTSESRFWAYVGAIPHWVYFTPLRQYQPQWFQFIVWTSGIGSISALLGIIVAIWMLSPSKKYLQAGAPTSIPYQGWKRWHTILGLAFGVLTLTWAFSGLLSMGPFEFLDRLSGNVPAQGGGRRGGAGNANIAAALRGAGRFDLADYAAKSPRDALAEAGADFRAKELEFTMFDGKPLYLLTDSSGATRIVPVQGEPRKEFDPERILSIVREASGESLAELKLINEYDAYYEDRRAKKSLPVIYARLKGDPGTRYYIDVKTGQIVGTYNPRNWINRWMYHGLHSLDFPFLYKHRPLWDIVVISLMLGGTAVCITSLVLTWQVLRRKLSI